MTNILEGKSVRPPGEAILSRLAPTQSARQGEYLLLRDVEYSG